MNVSDGVSVVIPSRGDPMGLWMTITATDLAIMNTAPREYIVVVNGQELSEYHQLLEERSGVRIIHHPESIPPPIARNIGAREAKHKMLCFLDDHVIPECNMFSWGEIDAQLIHVSYSTYPSHPLRYWHYIPSEELPTKGDYATEPTSKSVYPCISGAHGGFFCDRKAFIESNGYDEFWQGFGGEEGYLGMKMSALGHKVVMVPWARFWHFSCRPAQRGYDKTINHWNYEEGYRQIANF